jgi:ribonuclease P/MRP protein subunit POP8
MARDADLSMADISGLSKSKKSHELVKSVIKASPYSYAHLEFYNAGPHTPEELDILQVRSFCTAALKQFLGATGMAMPLDILKLEGRSCWLRLPREDLGAFAAAITSWQGTVQDNICSTFRIRGCSDWLGALVGQRDEQGLWTD